MLVNKKEALRYLGYADALPNNAESILIDDCLQKLESSITPRCIFMQLPLSFLKSGVVCVGSLKIESNALFKAINACESAFLFAATLGTRADELLRFESAVSIARAAVMQAASASAIESYCDEKCNEIAQRLKPDGLYLRSRFSPGYGDFSLAHQPELLKLVQAQKIGLTCTESLMLAPTKSVTAVIGVSDIPCAKRGCDECGKADCEYRCK